MFLTECSIHDRSYTGACLILNRNIKIPGAIHLFDDYYRVLFKCDVRWQKGNKIGVSIEPRTLPLDNLTLNNILNCN